MKKLMQKKLLLPVMAASIALVPLAGPIQHVSAAAAVQAKTAAPQTAVVQVYVDGKKLALAPAPIVQKGTTLVPMKQIFNALQASVTWEPTTKTIIGAKDGQTVTLQSGSTKAVINGKAVTLAVPVQVIKGTTMVPLRVVAEGLGAELAIDAAAHTIRITSAEALLQQKLDKLDEMQEPEPEKLSVTDIVAMNDEKVVMITTNEALGSGVIVGDDQILTNYHVIKTASSANITLQDGSTAKVVGVVGYDEKTDLAIIQTEKPLGIEPVSIDMGMGVRKGDHVVAIGSPLGVQNTVSEGIVSNTETGDDDMIQISVPIDHGSSGGGLFNEYGDLVGITSAGIDDTHADLNFAVPAFDIYLLLYKIKNDPPEKVEFLPSDLPDTLVGASTDDIKALMEKDFAKVSTTQGETELKRFEVTRDSDGWVVITAVIDPSFYMIYGHANSDELRYWAIDAGVKLHELLPDDKLQLVVYYEQTFSFQPRGFDSSEVSYVGDGTWKLRYPVIQLQGKEKMNVQVRA